ncbi:MAG: hypothetical protein ACTHK7_06670 [Aureliella sp.]
MWSWIKILIAALVLAAVTNLAPRFPRLGAFVLTLPIVSILAFILTWERDHDLAVISRLARETLVLVPLGLPVFIPLAMAPRLGWSFWWALAAGIALAAIPIAAWLAFGPREI